MQGTEDNFNPNKNTADSDMSEAISETSKQDLTICDFISIPKSINRGSTHDQILKLDFKHKKKYFLWINATWNQLLLVI